MLSEHSVFEGYSQEHVEAKRRGKGRMVEDGGKGRDETEGTEDLLVYRRVAQNAVHWMQTRSRLYFHKA
jgi:hypothetical protein